MKHIILLVITVAVIWNCQGKRDALGDPVMLHVFADSTHWEMWEDAVEQVFAKTKEMPFLGRVSCNVEEMVCGSWQEIIIDYEIGQSGMADGSWFKATFRFYSDWELFQTSDPKAAPP